MVPAIFVVLDELPRTPSGKIDRRSLPAPEEDRTEETEATWRRATRPRRWWRRSSPRSSAVERVGINDNFFELGGHSLLATRLITRVRNAFEVDLPLRDFFSNATIASLAAMIEDQLIAQIDELSEEDVESMI